MTPVLRQDKTNLGCDVVPLEGGGRRLNIVGEEHATPVPMKFEFFDPFGQSAEMPEQPVFFLAGQIQGLKTARDQKSIADAAEDDQGKEAQQDLPGKPA